jgi:hypothetical protein
MANQFFNEPQFESYRKLGSFILKTIDGQAEGVVKETMTKHYTDCAAAVANGQAAPSEPVTAPYQALLAGARAQWARTEIWRGGRLTLSTGSQSAVLRSQR